MDGAVVEEEEEEEVAVEAGARAEVSDLRESSEILVHGQAHLYYHISSSQYELEAMTDAIRARAVLSSDSFSNLI